MTSPFSLVRQLMDDMDRMLSPAWAPAVETFEKDGRFVVRAELPGLSPEDVRIEASDDALTIEGERRSEMQAEEEGGVYRSERVYGRFSRTIPLPEEVDLDGAQARFENGVLEVSMQVATDATRRRRIEIEGTAKSQPEGGQQESGQPPVH